MCTYSLYNTNGIGKYIFVGVRDICLCWSVVFFKIMTFEEKLLWKIKYSITYAHAVYHFFKYYSLLHQKWFMKIHVNYM